MSHVALHIFLICVYLKPILLFSDGVKKKSSGSGNKGAKRWNREGMVGMCGDGGMAGREAASKL